MDREESNISILAGNSRVFLGDDQVINVEAQLKAFEAALLLASKCRELSSKRILPKLSVAFDHQGIFRLQFLTANLTNSQKRRPRLSHLHPDIQKVFQPVAENYQISLSEIQAIHEDSARQHLAHTLATETLPEILIQRILSESNSDSLLSPSVIDQKASAQRLTCAAITKEYFERASGHDNTQGDFLEVFFEDSPWSRSLAYVRGLQLSHQLGISSAIRLNLVSDKGEISQGDIISAPNA